jgi:hypothetical protein
MPWRTCLWYPSIIESFGHRLLEAMAAGLLVVAADVCIQPGALCRLRRLSALTMPQIALGRSGA